MAMFRRMGLFLLVNIVVMFTVTAVLSVLGVGPYLTSAGMNYGSLAAFCLVWGMGGAFISLLISKQMAIWGMGVQVIDTSVRDPRLVELRDTVHALATKAGLRGLPDVGVYDSPEVNAFATGPASSMSLVAVSTGLLRTMSREERDGVLAHEVAHIANGDMVTMTLIQGVVNAFAMFLARALAYAIESAMRGNDERGSPWIRFGLVMVFQMVFTLLGSVIVAWFSRWREYRADAGSAALGGRANMIRALQRLASAHEPVIDERAPALAAFKISGRGGLMRLLATHPPLEERIAALRASA